MNSTCESCLCLSIKNVGGPRIGVSVFTDHAIQMDAATILAAFTNMLPKLMFKKVNNGVFL
jgi:hypothetical protein